MASLAGVPSPMPELCWQIPDRLSIEHTPSPAGWMSSYIAIGELPQGKLEGHRVKFPAMHLSYRDFETLGYAIDHDRVEHGLPGRGGGWYNYQDGECDMFFRDAATAKAHCDLLVERGLLTLG